MRAGIGWAAAACLLLSACGVSDERLGTFVADPATYRVMTCEQLAANETAFKTRLTELDALMQKAGATSGGSVVNTIAYRPEHITVRGSLDAVRKVQAEKKCHAPEPPPKGALPPPQKPAVKPKR